jgi:hypothetical protein
VVSRGGVGGVWGSTSSACSTTWSHTHARTHTRTHAHTRTERERERSIGTEQPQTGLGVWHQYIHEHTSGQWAHTDAGWRTVHCCTARWCTPRWAAQRSAALLQARHRAAVDPLLSRKLLLLLLLLLLLPRHRRCLIGGDGGGGSGGWGLGAQEYPHAREQALCPGRFRPQYFLIRTGVT